MTKKGTWYENTVAEIAQLFYRGANIRIRHQVEGPDGKREVDVDVRWTEAGKDHFVLLECKDRKTPIDIGEIDALHSKSSDLNPDLVLLYSNSGFTKKALEKARRVGIGALSALSSGESQIRFVVERLCVAQALAVEDWRLTVFVADDEINFPEEWRPQDLYFQSLPVQNWLSAHSHQLLYQFAGCKEIQWNGAFYAAHAFDIKGTVVRLKGIRLKLNCSKRLLCQIVREDVSKGAFDHIRDRILIPSGQSYLLGGFDMQGWEAYDGALTEQRESGANEIAVSVLLFKGISPLPNLGAPDLTAILNPQEQKIEAI